MFVILFLWWGVICRFIMVFWEKLKSMICFGKMFLFIISVLRKVLKLLIVVIML